MSNPVTESLRLARERKKLTVTQVEEQTKIPARYILMIEKGDFLALPPHVPGEQYIHSLASFLEVNPDPILKAYQAAKHGTNQRSLSTTSSPSGLTVFLSRRETMKIKQQMRQDLAGGWKKWLTRWYVYVPIAVVILLIPVCIWLWSDEKSTPLQADASGSISPSTSGQQPLKKNLAEVELVQAAETSESGVDVYQVKNVDQLHIKIKAKDPTKVVARAEDKKGKVLLEETIPDQATKELSHEKGIYLKISRPGQVVLSVNDIVIDTSEMKEAHTFQFKLN
ncbi:helix-turn-helix domain-containing protein [Thermoflavimicrobium dichotomicum]|uniref:Helix-turn-helix domain-containing protein n=1 Tax=Thermoflavimicrobium dichotomicum TaxID=46223 RepID=A0A1I3PTT7_9BACL|nr:RodZ domain-containing protein [Thermoflavimicrobium dichotomicum]SFJ24641.1 Helix-turn-helix domain-containing protein [Thermoflavimicrobium dichotomicum]